MTIERINCIYHTDFGKCNHLDRGRGFLGLGKLCVIHEDFVGSCTEMIRHEPMVPPGVPTPGDEPLPPGEEASHIEAG